MANKNKQELRVEYKSQNVLEVFEVNPEVQEDSNSIHYCNTIEDIPIDRASARLYIDHVSDYTWGFLANMIDKESKHELVYYDINKSFGIIPIVQVNGRCYPIISINRWKDKGCKIDFMKHPGESFIRSIPINSYVQLQLDNILKLDEVDQREKISDIEWNFLETLRIMRDTIIERRDARRCAFDVKSMEADESAFLLMKVGDQNVREMIQVLFKNLLVYMGLNDMKIQDISSSCAKSLYTDNWMDCNTEIVEKKIKKELPPYDLLIVSKVKDKALGIPYTAVYLKGEELPDYLTPISEPVYLNQLRSGWDRTVYIHYVSVKAHPILEGLVEENNHNYNVLIRDIPYLITDVTKYRSMIQTVLDSEYYYLISVRNIELEKKTPPDTFEIGVYHSKNSVMSYYILKLQDQVLPDTLIQETNAEDISFKPIEGTNKYKVVIDEMTEEAELIVTGKIHYATKVDRVLVHNDQIYHIVGCVKNEHNYIITLEKESDEK